MRATLEIVDITAWWDQQMTTPVRDLEPIPFLSIVVSGPDPDIWLLCLEIQTGQRDILSHYLTHSNPAEGSWIYEGRTIYDDPASRRVYESNAVLTNNKGTVIKG